MTNLTGFSGYPLDRADALRDDKEGMAALLADPGARLLQLDGLEPVPSTEGGLSWRAIEKAADGVTLALLGLDERRRPHFAALADPSPGAPAFTVMGMLATMSAAEAAIYAGARSLVDWHARNRFCANCGQGTNPFRAGWARLCDKATGGCGTEHFPRTDPVVIMLAEHEGRVLLGRQPRFPAGRYSALAGFVEVGESIEDAVIREIHEEAGVRVRNVRYVASQPWPFPSSLMIACVAEAQDDVIRIDEKELDDAKWVDRAGVIASLEEDPDAPFIAPPPIAIAHTLLNWWAAQG